MNALTNKQNVLIFIIGIVLLFLFLNYMKIKESNRELLDVTEIEINKYDKVVAFTFDDGPSEYTTKIVDLLVKNNSKATFFQLGNRMKYNQKITKYVYEKGMEVSSHSYSHKNLNNLNIRDLLSEINSTNIIFNEITGSNISLMRPPYGINNEYINKMINKPIIMWNIDTNDWLYRDSEKIYEHIIKNISDGSIILMHDIYPETVIAVENVLPVLNNMGYKVTTVSELAKIKDIKLENGKMYSFIK